MSAYYLVRAGLDLALFRHTGSLFALGFAVLALWGLVRSLRWHRRKRFRRSQRSH